MTLQLEVVPLSGHLSRGDFDCGDEQLNDWLRTKASQHEKRGLSRTYLAVPMKGTLDTWEEEGFKDIDDTTVLGFYALSSAQVVNTDLPVGSKLPRNVPVVRLARLAVHQNLKGRGFGKMLLMEALVRAAQVGRTVGVAGLFVDAKPEAVGFYESFGFQAAESNPLKLWIPMSSILEILTK
ncbi:GNAT family N-acetyltransferase [Xanthomonas sacchari]|uniref:GNAT family N-acetyltransferase n=1 Tax=Xanthomonas sp. SHU 308 TaxID=1591201 RepID=UPI0004755008|nr:GNAT family N-acetyltransferase [Xanthomonas sp. SHU 308]